MNKSKINGWQLAGLLAAVMGCIYVIVTYWLWLLIFAGLGLAGFIAFKLFQKHQVKLEKQARKDELERLSLEQPPASRAPDFYTDPLCGTKVRYWDGTHWQEEARVQRKKIKAHTSLAFPGVYVYTYRPYLTYFKKDRTLFKIGMTTTSIEERVRRQSRSTEIPDDAWICRAFPTHNPRELEAIIHERLKPFRHDSRSGGTEWFWTTLEEIDAIYEALQNDPFYVDPDSYARLKKKNEPISHKHKK